MERSYKGTILSLFPPPEFLAMPSVGIDLSDHTVKFVELHRGRNDVRVGRFDEEKMPDGIVVSGRIQKSDELVKILATFKKKHKLRFIRASLPEEIGFLFELSLPKMSNDEIRGAIEFRLEENVPLDPVEVVFGYDVISKPARKGTPGGYQVVVSAFPQAVALMYAQLFHNAGLMPLSLEIEPQAVARSVVPQGDLGTYIIVDFGRERSGISVVSGGAVRFTKTITVGGSGLSDAFKAKYPDLNNDEMINMKNTNGLYLLSESDDKAFKNLVESTVEGLIVQIQKHMEYWHTHSGSEGGKPTRVSKVLLCGGNSNLAGLPEYLSRAIHLPVVRANVWRNAFSLEDHVPAGISFQESLGYAPAIGLALRGIGSGSMLNEGV